MKKLSDKKILAEISNMERSANTLDKELSVLNLKKNKPPKDFDLLIEQFNDLVKKFNSLKATIGKTKERTSKVESAVKNLNYRFDLMGMNYGGTIFKIERRLDILEERTALIPKLYDNVDKLVGEIIENSQERIFMNRRISKLEKIVYKT